MILFPNPTNKDEISIITYISYKQVNFVLKDAHRLLSEIAHFDIFQPISLQPPAQQSKSIITFTTTQLQPTTFLAFPSLSILHKPDHSPNFLLSSI